MRGEPLYDTLRRRMLAENKTSKVQAGMGLKRSVEGDPGLFGPGSMMWRVNRERIVLLSGPAAVTLQVAHPQVARAVANHSRFREDPVSRLRGTLDAAYSVTFGTQEEARLTGERVAAIHRTIRGPGYSAFDQGAQQWVLATLIMGSLRMFERFVGELGIPEKERMLRENVAFGRVFGLAPGRLPQSWEAFLAYWNEMLDGPLLGSDPLCGEVARAVLAPRRPWFLRWASPFLTSLATEWIPPALSVKLGIRPNALPTWKALDLCAPSLLRILPSGIRHEARYRKALSRMQITASRKNTSS